MLDHGLDQPLLGADTGYFQKVNPLQWVAKLEEIRLRHVEGNAEHAVKLLTKFVARYADASGREEERRIAAAKRRTLGGNEKEVVTRVARMELPAVTRARAREAWEIALSHTDTDGPPNMAWGFAQGLTRYSQTIPHATVRTAHDRSAGRILMLAGYSESKSCRSIAVAGGLWYNLSQVKRVPSETGVPHVG